MRPPFATTLAPILDRHDDAALESFLHDHRSRLSASEPDHDHFAARAAWALTAYYDVAKNVGLGSTASKCRFGLIDLYPEGRVFVAGVGHSPSCRGRSSPPNTSPRAPRS